MKTVIKLLRKELLSWRLQYSSVKIYWKGNEKQRLAKYDFEVCKLHISELEKAIEKLK